MSDRTNMESDNNLYYSTGVAYIIKGGVPSSTWLVDHVLDGTLNATWGWEGNSPNPADPLFVDPDNGDFHLQAESPAIGAGVAISGITIDKDGVSYNNPPSIGAYEYTG